MSLAITADKALVWDNQRFKMVPKIRVGVSLIGNKGSVYREAGPLFVETAQEVFEAVELLRARLIKSLLAGVGQAQGGSGNGEQIP
jgi:hypothetical protein